MSEEDEELEEIRQRRLLDVQRSVAQEQQKKQAQQELESRKQALLRGILTPEARQRLTNLKMVRPKFAEQLELQLIQIAQQGRVPLPIDDDQLKEILSRLQPTRREIKIRRL